MLIKNLASNFERVGEKLEEEVNQHLKEGWVPQGGVGYAMGTGMSKSYLTQAMIKEDK